MRRLARSAAGMSEQSPRRLIPRWLGCLIKGPLGCLAFLLGAGLVIVLFLPAVAGRIFDRSLEDWFHERHAGSLEVSEAWLGSVYGPQRVKSLILRDPSGEEVLRAELEGPSLGPVLLDGAEEYGPVRVRVRGLKLVEDEHGVTNLARALAPRPGGPPGDAGAAEVRWGRREGFELDAPLPVYFEIVVERCSTVERSGARGLIENATFDGSLTWSRAERRFSLEGGQDPAVLEALHLELSAGEVSGERARPWEFSLEGTRIPTTLFELCAGTGGVLGEILGPRIDVARAAGRVQGR